MILYKYLMLRLKKKKVKKKYKMTQDLSKLDSEGEVRLDRIIQAILVNYEQIHPDLFQAINYCLSQGGKKLRPKLLLLTAELFSKEEAIDCMPTAIAIELLHNYTLIHDDLPSMDDGKLRRNMPTVHVKYGEAIAILAGDGLQALAYEQLITQQTTSLTSLIELITSFSMTSGLLGIIDGQAKDLDKINKFSSTEINSLKTAKLFSFATEAPAIIYGLNPNDHNRLLLKEIGYKYGLAFQLYDDIQDDIEDQRQIDKAKTKEEIKALIFEAISATQQLSNLNDIQPLINFSSRLVKLVER